jgi:hypothetical protein
MVWETGDRCDFANKRVKRRAVTDKEEKVRCDDVLKKRQTDSLR